jgi:transposase InsO family protein
LPEPPHAHARRCKASPASITGLADPYHISLATARKWKRREDVQDRSPRPHTLSTTLTPAQDILVVELRRSLLRSLDDLWSVTRACINPAASRSGLDRGLRRHGVSPLKSLYPQVEGEAATKKTFKDDEPGFLPIDITYLTHMPDDTQRRYLFVAIDRATRWVYRHISRDQIHTNSTDFLRRVHQAAPMTIQKVLTDTGSQFTDRFPSQEKRPTGEHVFDLACATLSIEPRRCPPRHPQPNGRVERFNGRLSEWVKQTHFASATELETTLEHDLKIYHHHIPQRAFTHQTPIHALEKWQKEKPDVFVKRVYKQAGLDK